MSTVYAIGIGTVIFLMEVFARYWVMAKSWEVGRVVAWGLDDGIRISIPERQFRLWMVYMPFSAFSSASSEACGNGPCREVRLPGR